MDKPNDDYELRSVITIRLPVSLHAALKNEARRQAVKRGEDVSLNSLCIEKLTELLR